MNWWSIEVLNGASSAARWRDAYGGAMVEAAVSHGARDWAWQRHPWGVVFEVAFTEHDVWSIFRRLPGVQAALDAVPDPVNGLLIYPGRGGSAGAGDRRRPRPHLGAGAAPLPEEPEPIIVARPAEVG
jgi:hypothetical protein